MSTNTKIEWCDSTFNPWVGCTKISPACDNCYAAVSTPARSMGVAWGAGNPRHRTSAKNWKQPVIWNARADAFRECASCGWRGDLALRDEPLAFACPSCDVTDWMPARRRVFCASLADVFDNEVPMHWRFDLFKLIVATPDLDWLLLTKRVGNVSAMLNDAAAAVTGDFVGAKSWDSKPWPNVWIGATITSQAEADRDIPKLLAVPAARRFLSMEPLLAPVDMKQWMPTGRLIKRAGTGEPFMAPHFFMTQCEHCGWIGSSELARLVSYGDDADTVCPSCDKTFACDEVAGIDWVIVGGESGPNARPMHPEWARSLRDQCAAAGVPFLFKQWGEWAPGDGFRGWAKHWSPITEGFIDGMGDRTTRVERVGKKAAGRLLDGVEHNGFPASAVTP